MSKLHGVGAQPSGLPQGQLLTFQEDLRCVFALKSPTTSLRCDRDFEAFHSENIRHAEHCCHLKCCHNGSRFICALHPNILQWLGLGIIDSQVGLESLVHRLPGAQHRGYWSKMCIKRVLYVQVFSTSSVQSYMFLQSFNQFNLRNWLPPGHHCHHPYFVDWEWLKVWIWIDRNGVVWSRVSGAKLSTDVNGCQRKSAHGWEDVEGV